jgi:hypothetical protein
VADRVPDRPSGASGFDRGWRSSRARSARDELELKAPDEQDGEVNDDDDGGRRDHLV